VAVAVPIVGADGLLGALPKNDCIIVILYLIDLILEIKIGS
jgi:hypothetical protein